MKKRRESENIESNGKERGRGNAPHTVQEVKILNGRGGRKG